LLSTISRLLHRSDERGQVLVLFAGGITALLIIAALAFDAGMMLVERRDEQNAADAAALAGARHILLDETAARTAAFQVADLNGYDNAEADENVFVHIPPIHGVYATLPGFIEVQIEATRPSIFGSIVGKASWPIGAYAVATNSQNLVFPFSMLALNKTACKAIHVSGGGVIEAYGNIQSNSNGSDCAGDPVGFSRSGGSTINVYAPDATCRAVGEIQDQGSGSMTCTVDEGSFALPDPLLTKPDPVMPPLADPMQFVGPGTAPSEPPRYCPGNVSNPPNPASPSRCRLGNPSGTYGGLSWILYPGLYPGGLEVSANTTAYLMPGIYWIGGGGVDIGGGGSIFTIATETDATPNVADATWGGGVLIFNSKLPASAGGPIILNSDAATMKLKMFDAPAGDPLEVYDTMVIFQDRTVTTSVTLNGSDSETVVEGIIYVPAGQVKLNGNGGTLIVDQVIADTYDINGNGGTIKVLRNVGVDAIITAAGLVE
jgi:Putative Flp pilus-assembly TadE/G-like